MSHYKTGGFLDNNNNINMTPVKPLMLRVKNSGVNTEGRDRKERCFENGSKEYEWIIFLKKITTIKRKKANK